MTIPEPEVMVTQYVVSCLPDGYLERDLWSITVEYRGREKWAVKRLSYCYDANGERSYESIPSERRDEWLAQYRHNLDDALALAKRLAPTLRINGWGVAEALARGRGDEAA